MSYLLAKVGTSEKQKSCKSKEFIMKYENHALKNVKLSIEFHDKEWDSTLLGQLVVQPDFQKSFSDREPIKHYELSVDIEQEKQEKLVVIDTIRFKNPDDKVVFDIGKNNLVIKTSDYSGWPSFRKNCECALSSYMSLDSERIVKEVSLVFVNEVKNDVKDAVEGLFNISPRIPCGGKMDDFIVGFLDNSIKMSPVRTILRGDQNMLRLQIGCEVSFEKNTSMENVLGSLDEYHEQIVSTFEKSITDFYREKIR